MAVLDLGKLNLSHNVVRINVPELTHLTTNALLIILDEIVLNHLRPLYGKYQPRHMNSYGLGVME